MKLFPALALLVLSVSATAYAEPLEINDEVVLNTKKIAIDAPTASVVRTAATPKVVKVTMQVPMGERICEENGVRDVFGRNPACGYDTVYRQRFESICVSWANTRRGQHCVLYRRRTVTYPVSVMRACTYPATYCIRFGTATHFAPKRVKLIFRKAAPLFGNEKETFLLSGEQTRIDSANANFSLLPLSTKATYRVKSSSFLGDRLKLQQVGDEAFENERLDEATVEVVSEID